MSPLKRFIRLLQLDKKDITQIFFYAIFSGLISLSLPLGIQAIVNFIQSGRTSASWVILVILVVVGVALGGYLSIMQLRITESLQQKIFIRSSFEFAGRLPKIDFQELARTYTPELANRFFDTINIQKGTSKLLLDFSGAILQIVFGILLLSFYHPYFILFGVLLALLLYFIFKYSFVNGLDTSLKESKVKYKVASWLQEMARNYFSFKNQDHFNFAIQKNDRLVQDYLNYREQHFHIIKRQFSQLVIFKIIITACLLVIGGVLVLQNQINIGQFVASEIIILLVINSVEKIILGLETFYDVLTSVEKIAEVTEMKLEKELNLETNYCYNAINMALDNVRFKYTGSKDSIIKGINLKIEQGEKVLISGENGSGKTTLLRIMAGLIPPTMGNLIINDDTFNKIDSTIYRSYIGTIFANEAPFEGTIRENITYNCKDISNEQIKWALDAVLLTDYIKTLPQGLDTSILPDGKMISSSVAQKILIARGIIRKPKILFFENPTDKIDSADATKIIDFITDKTHQWTIVVISKNNRWINNATREITLQDGKILTDKNIQNA
jgi:ABC-type bacteriocin/lantibiotic exporter with double-glycine peptidase domain